MTEAEQHDKPAPSFAKIHCSFGFESEKSDNLFFIDDHTLLFAVGNVIQLLDDRTYQQMFVQDSSQIGIGAIALHPSKKFFAVAGKGTSHNPPLIFVYTYPELKVHKVLKGGTAIAYTAMTFNHYGTKLASVGSAPDHTLTVWDWDKELILLRSKAFSQDVAKVYFSPVNEGRLITSGTGHIKFWEMAKTFTGLKLQGEIGKFGKSELTDIPCFVELPNGRVLSGTERGNLLLWDDNAIKREIWRKLPSTTSAAPASGAGVALQPCHDGMVDVMFLEIEKNQVITAGSDGYIRFWSFEALDSADVSAEASKPIEVEPSQEILVEQGVQIKSIVRAADHWIIQDSTGALWKLEFNSAGAPSSSYSNIPRSKILSFHSGSITGLDTSPASHIAATTGDDGTVRVYNYHQSTTLAATKFPTAGSSLCWAPLVCYATEHRLIRQSLDESGCTFAVGFVDGVVRVFKYSPNGLKVIKTTKPHNQKITSLSYSPNGEQLASGSEDCTVFFLHVNDKYSPIGFIKTPTPVHSMSWTKSSRMLLLCCTGGDIFEVTRPSFTHHDIAVSYELSGLPMIPYSLKRKEKPKPVPAANVSNHEKREVVENQPGPSASPPSDQTKDEEEEQPQTPTSEPDSKPEAQTEGEAKPAEEAATAPAQAQPAQPQKADEVEEPLEETKRPGIAQCVLYLQTTDTYFFATMDSVDAGFLYLCRTNVEYPEEEIPTHPAPCSYLAYSNRNSYLLSGTVDGSIHVKTGTADKDLWSLHLHDGNYGRITRVCSSFDESYFLTAGVDGNLFVLKVNDKQPQSTQCKYIWYFYSNGTVISRESDNSLAENKSDHGRNLEPSPSEDSEIKYSIQEEKLRKEQDRILHLAEEKKNEMRKKVARLRKELEGFLTSHSKLAPEEQLSADDLHIDPHLSEMVAQDTQKKKSNVQQELAWASEHKDIQLSNLKHRYFENIATQRVIVKGFKSSNYVATFALRHLPKHVQEQIEAVHVAIQREQEIFEQKEAKKKQALLGPNATGKALKQGGSQADSKNGSQLEKKEKMKKFMTSKLEEKQQKRKQRQIEWQRFETAKPTDKDDPTEMELIRQAELYMGDYPLKLDLSYRVPEHKRINTEKKNHQKILLEESIYHIKLEFNARVLALRDIKEKIIIWITKANQRITEINKTLGSNEPLVTPKLEVQ